MKYFFDVTREQFWSCNSWCAYNWIQSWGILKVVSEPCGPTLSKWGNTLRGLSCLIHGSQTFRGTSGSTLWISKSDSVLLISPPSWALWTLCPGGVSSWIICCIHPGLCRDAYHRAHCRKGAGYEKRKLWKICFSDSFPLSCPFFQVTGNEGECIKFTSKIKNHEWLFLLPLGSVMETWLKNL